jgi:hypothetical protein
VGAVRLCKVSFKGQLESSELLNGTTGGATLTVAEVTTTDLTIGGAIFNASTITIDDDTAVLAGQAVTFSVTGQLEANSPYTIKITCTTDASQTLVAYVVIKCSNK